MHREALAVLAHEHGLEALARRARASAPARRQAHGLALLVLRRPARAASTAAAGAARSSSAREADHRAERRVDVGDAALQVARAQAGDQRVLHRLAKGQRLGQRGFGARRAGARRAPAAAPRANSASDRPSTSAVARLGIRLGRPGRRCPRAAAASRRAGRPGARPRYTPAPRAQRRRAPAGCRRLRRSDSSCRRACSAPAPSSSSGLQRQRGHQEAGVAAGRRCTGRHRSITSSPAPSASGTK